MCAVRVSPRLHHSTDWKSCQAPQLQSTSGKLHTVIIESAFKLCPQKSISEISQAVKIAIEEPDNSSSQSNGGAQKYYLKNLPGSKVIIVWKSKKAHNEGLAIIRSGLTQAKLLLLARLVACRATAGTEVIVTDAGFVTHDIMIVEGQSVGCRGNIPAEELELR